MNLAAPAARAAGLCWDCAAWRWGGVPARRGGGWIACSELLDPRSAELEHQLALVAERQATTRLSVTASLLLERYAWALATAAFAGLLEEGCLPDLGAANVAVRLDAGGFVDALLLDDPRMEPLEPGDAVERLAQGLLGDHLLPLVERLAARSVHRGRRALLCLVVDALAAAIAGAASVAGTPLAEASALSDALAGLLGSPPGLHPRLLSVDAALIRKRAVCCLLHAERAAHCATCPHLTDDETVRRMRVLATPD